MAREIILGVMRNRAAGRRRQGLPDRARSQRAGRICQSRLVQTPHRIDRGGDPSPGTSPPPQPPQCSVAVATSSQACTTSSDTE
jgi:hypothetical protein